MNDAYVRRALYYTTITLATVPFDLPFNLKIPLHFSARIRNTCDLEAG